MKVVHISYSDSGGAGLAALRLHRALLAKGTESYLLCLHKNSSEKNVIRLNKPILVKALERCPFILNSEFIKENNHNYECMSFPCIIDYISSHKLIKEADIINLHWVGNMLNYRSFFKTIKKPIVWTLHDMNPFLGFSHYMGDVNMNINNIDKEKKIQELKSKYIHSANNLNIVTLCNWMKNYSESSLAFKGRKHYIIYNSVDTNIFKIYNKQYLREILGIPKNKTILLFISQHLTNKRKGGDMLLDVLNTLGNNTFSIIVGANMGSFKTLTNIKYFGTIKDELMMALLYSAADAFILPSREDNLPNTMLESLSCGTPVITMPNGGMVDIIKNNINGVIADRIDSQSLFNAIEEFIDNKSLFNSYSISENAHNMFAPDVQANKYLELYNKILFNENN